MITQDELCRKLSYEKETGEFRWKVPTRNRDIGDIAGTVNKDGYRTICINGELYSAHRLVWLYMLGEFPSFQLDHINLDKADNRWNNLRGATASLNCANTRKKIFNTSGYKGVTFVPTVCKWRARIGGKYSRSLGLFVSKKEAADAYRDAVGVVFGEYARW